MHLQKILAKMQTTTHGHADTANESVDVTDKVKALVRLLDETWSPNVRGLIFVEQRAVVAALASLLREKALTSSTWSIGTFVGTSSFANRKTNLADLAEIKEQAQDLKDFYNGTKNLMITTSVLEEGIDVSNRDVEGILEHPADYVLSHGQQRIWEPASSGKAAIESGMLPTGRCVHAILFLSSLFQS